MRPDWTEYVPRLWLRRSFSEACTTLLYSRRIPRVMNRKARCSMRAYPAGAGLLAVLVLAVSSVLVAPVGAAPVRQTPSEVDMLRPLSGKEFEVEFLNAMIMHHQGA